MNGHDRFFVLTGGPGAGKTTLLETLAADGLATAPEAGRAVIRMQQEIGGTALPWADRMLFAELMLAFDMRSHEEAVARSGSWLFDRGIPDLLGYLALEELPVPDHFRAAAALRRYKPLVFILPPWARFIAVMPNAGRTGRRRSPRMMPLPKPTGHAVTSCAPCRLER